MIFSSSFCSMYINCVALEVETKLKKNILYTCFANRTQLAHETAFHMNFKHRRNNTKHFVYTQAKIHTQATVCTNKKKKLFSLLYSRCDDYNDGTVMMKMMLSVCNVKRVSIVENGKNFYFSFLTHAYNTEPKRKKHSHNTVWWMCFLGGIAVCTEHIHQYNCMN